MRGFGGFHPAVLFSYYAVILCISMVTMHPVLILISLTGAFAYFGMMKGIRKMLEELFFYFCLFLLMLVINPLFNHNGETILFFMNNNPVTLEATMYGAFAALMILSVLMWCRCYAEILTTDKFLYLFGKMIPKLGLILSMAFRFIPSFHAQMKKISQSQKTMGLYAANKVSDKVKSGVRVFDCLISWSMENSIDTADAMKARGYGLKGRTNFSLFRFTARDGMLFGIMGLLAGITIAGLSIGKFKFFYYPYVAEVPTGAGDMIRYGIVFLLLIIPALVEGKEKLSWNYSRSKI